MVVDDDEISRRLIARGLQRAGYETLEAESADVALRLLRKPESVALLITDVMMPETDGLDLIAELRNTPGLAQLPVLICSSLGKSEAVARAAELNVAGYLLKPIQIARLRAKVRQVMEGVSRPLVDIPTTLNRLDTDMDGYLEMLALLDAKLTSHLAELRGNPDNLDALQAVGWASALAGAASNLGAARLAEALERLAVAAERHDLEGVKSGALTVEREVLILRNEVQSLQKPQPRTEPPVAASQNQAPREETGSESAAAPTTAEGAEQKEAQSAAPAASGSPPSEVQAERKE